MRNARRRRSANRSLVDGFHVTRSSPVAFVRELILGQRPLTRLGGGRGRARAAHSQGLKLEALERRLLLSAELSTIPLASVTMFETEGSYPPAVAASFTPQPTIDAAVRQAFEKPEIEKSHIELGDGRGGLLPANLVEDINKKSGQSPGGGDAGTGGPAGPGGVEPPPMGLVEDIKKSGQSPGGGDAGTGGPVGPGGVEPPPIGFVEDIKKSGQSPGGGSGGTGGPVGPGVLPGGLEPPPMGLVQTVLTSGASAPGQVELSAPRQVVFLDTSGALDVDYNGPVSVTGVDVPRFAASGELAGQEDAIIGAMMDALDKTNFGFDLVFTKERPASGDYSTVYIGGTGDEFAEWGPFLGLAEDADTGNLNHSDDAFVFSGNVAIAGLTAQQYGEELARIVAHEVEHLVGIEPEHPVVAGNPLTAVAAVGDAIPGEVQVARIGAASDPGGGLQKLFNLAKSIEDLPALQVKIPGIDKSVAQLLSLSNTIKDNLQDPIIELFDGGGTPTFQDLFDIFGATGTVQPGNQAFEVAVDLQKLISDTLLHFSLGDSSVGDGSGGFGLQISGDINVDALVAFMDAATQNLKFAFGVDLSNASNPFYIKAETLKLHASADADPTATPATGLNFQSSLGFLSVSVVDGSLTLDADITIDL